MNHVRHQLARLLRWSLLLVLGLVQVVHAQGTATMTLYSIAGMPGGPYASMTAVAAAYGPYIITQISQCGAPFTIVGTTINNLTVQTTVYGANECGTRGAGVQFIAGTGTATTTQGTGTLPCPSAGSLATRNFTYAWDNSPNGGSDVSQLTNALSLAGSTSCVSGGGSSCTAVIGSFPVQAFSSVKPSATGLYRHSVDYEISYTGASCTPTAADKKLSEATDPVPQCPGAYGTVNGVPTCVPSASRTTVPKPVKSDGTDAPVIAGNPSAGSSGSDAIGNRSPATGTNNGNNGSAPSSYDGASLRWGGGIPATTGTTAGSGSGSTLKAEDIKTDCDKKPNSIGCSEYGTPDGSVTLGRSDSGFSSIAVVSFGSAASCPAPLPFDVAGRSYSVSFQSICTNANDYIRPVVLVLAAALAAFIFVAGFRS